MSRRSIDLKAIRLNLSRWLNAMTDNDAKPRPPETLQILARDLASGGERDALVSFAGADIRHVSFRALAAEVDTRARMLAARGIGADDPVILCGSGGPDWIVACLALLRCGACVVPVDSQLAAQTFRHVVKDCGARLALASPQAIKRYGALLDEAKVAVLPHAAAVEPPAASGADFPVVDPAARAVLCYTSGTTGPPKGVPLTHRNIAFQIGVLAGAGLVTASDRVLLPLPLHHVYPLVIGMLAPLALHLALVLPDGFTGPRILAALRQGRATVMIGVPRLYGALVDAIAQQFNRRGRVAAAIFRVLLGLSRLLRRSLRWRVGKVLFAPIHRRFGPSLRTVVSGGAALNPEIALTLEALGWQVGSGYGLTETSPMLTFNPPGAARLDTAGRAVPGVELRIAAGEGDPPPLGEVQARGPGVFAGYRGLPDKTRAAFTADGWFRTGDLGWLDGDWLHLAGRRSTLIVTAGGENVQPEDVEEAYAAHPAIAELAAFERHGRVAALIVPNPALWRDGKPDEAVRQAIADISRTLPSYQRIAEYRLTREAIPRTRLGKPRIHLIAERYRLAALEAGEAGPAEPAAIDEFSADDQALVENEAAFAAFELLAERFAGRRVTPDSDLQLDLGIDSIEWLDLSFALSERTGAVLSEAAIAELHTVRDLLVQIAQGGAGGAVPAATLDDPEAMLDERQRRWLQPKGPVLRAAGRLLAAANRGAMRALFKLTVQGAENLPAEGPYVLAPNHASYLDPFALAAALGTERLERLYWAGWTGVVFGGPCRRAFARLAQAVPVDPLRASASSLAFGGATLRRGQGLVWFPEGARSRDGRLQPFRPGLGRLLDRWRVPVVPVVISGTHAAWPPSQLLPSLHPLRVEFLPPAQAAELAAEGQGKSQAERIVDALHRRVAEAI
jgi:long-chain acyl-CoA synthetase